MKFFNFILKKLGNSLLLAALCIVTHSSCNSKERTGKQALLDSSEHLKEALQIQQIGTIDSFIIFRSKGCDYPNSEINIFVAKPQQSLDSTIRTANSFFEIKAKGFFKRIAAKPNILLSQWEGEVITSDWPNNSFQVSFYFDSIGTYITKSAPYFFKLTNFSFQTSKCW